MCGRFSEFVKISILSKRFKFQPRDIPWKSRYNLAPGQQALTVVQREEREPVMMKWGLIPSWAKDPTIGFHMINARVETLLEKPSFRKPLMESRCLVLADGFYEWKVVPGQKQKIPMRIVLKSREPFAFAGLWDRWMNPQGQPVDSFAIITMPANDVMKPIHERMPVILEEKNEDAWLDPAVWDPKVLRPLLTPYPSELIDFYPVSTVVNSAQHDDESCIAPVSLV